MYTIYIEYIIKKIKSEFETERGIIWEYLNGGRGSWKPCNYIIKQEAS